jgi:hypothetical protein
MKGYTTIEQSKKLIELGIDADTADMYHSIIPESITNENGNLTHNIGVIQSVHNVTFSDIKRTLENVYDKYNEVQFIPCWSTEALLDILDETIVTNEEDEYTLHFGKDGTSYYMHYEDAYRSMNNIIDELDFCCSTLLNCAFEMIVKLKEMRLL